MGGGWQEPHRQVWAPLAVTASSHGRGHSGPPQHRPPSAGIPERPRHRKLYLEGNHRPGLWQSELENTAIVLLETQVCESETPRGGGAADGRTDGWGLLQGLASPEQAGHSGDGGCPWEHGAFRGQRKAGLGPGPGASGPFLCKSLHAPGSPPAAPWAPPEACSLLCHPSTLAWPGSWRLAGWYSPEAVGGRWDGPQDMCPGFQILQAGT